MFLTKFRTPDDLVSCIFVILLVCSNKFLTSKEWNEWRQVIATEWIEERDELNVAMYELDPGMRIVLLETVKGFTERKVADEVQGGPIVSLNHDLTLWSLSTSVLMELLDKEMGIILYYLFLFAQSFL